MDKCTYIQKADKNSFCANTRKEKKRSLHPGNLLFLLIEFKWPDSLRITPHTSLLFPPITLFYSALLITLYFNTENTLTKKLGILMSHKNVDVS